MIRPTRRRVLQGLLGTAGALSLAPTLARAATPDDRRFVLLVLRGGMDGLGAIPAHGDPDYREARGAAALPQPGQQDGVVDLDGQFGLHPALGGLLPMWERGHLAIVHATSLPYGARSHFDAQDLLENGTDRPFGAATGWLNRALSASGAPVTAMAMGRGVPLVLRGPSPVTAADPLREQRLGPDLLERIEDLYRGDPLLEPALRAGLRTQDMLATARTSTRLRRADTESAAGVIGGLIAHAEGPRVAVLELSGWDTHTSQDRVLGRQLEAVAGALTGLQEAMGAVWGRTLVLAVSEFGRTVAANGTGGTDHGTAGAVLLAGGAVAGGEVFGRWPGLARRQLVAERDLAATTDLRSVFKGVLAGHLGVREGPLEDDVFPGSREAPPLEGLVRG